MPSCRLATIIIPLITCDMSLGQPTHSSEWPEAFDSACHHVLDAGSMGNFSRASGGNCSGRYWYADSPSQRGERVDFSDSQVHQWLGDIRVGYTGPGYILCKTA